MNPKDLLGAVNAHIDTLALAERSPKNLYEPMAYLLSLKGKRIRPVLALLAYSAASRRDPKEALNLAVALELFHNFTLMHDDIMDRAPVRRGEPTVHIKWDTNIAILSGDAMFAFTLDMVSRDFPAQAAALIRAYTRVSLGVCEGQMEDMDLATENEVSIPRYIEMIRKKTAVLLGGALEMGAIAGGASPEVAGKLRLFGEFAGIGFQLHDDLMDAFPPANFGKQIGGDIIENKKTYLILRTLELANVQQRERLVYAYSLEEDQRAKVATVVGIFREIGIDTLTRDLANDYFDRAQVIGKELAADLDMAALHAYVGEIAERQV